MDIRKLSQISSENIKVLAITIVILLGFVGIIGAQSIFILPTEDGSPLKGNFSYKFFRADTLVKVEIPIQLTNNALQFQLDNGQYEARYKIGIALYDDDELILTQSATDSLSVGKYSATNLSDLWNAKKFQILLHKGKYKLYLILDDLNAKTKAKSQITIKVPDPKKIKISTSWFFVPENDSLVISAKVPALWDSLGVCAQIYDIPESSRVKLIISGARVKTRDYKGIITVDGGDTIAAAIFPISKMPGGQYRADLRILDKNGKKIARTKNDFTLIQTPKSMMKYHFDELINQLELIANPSEIKKLENADSTERDSLWDEFWTKRDLSPNTELNEAKEEFFRRVQYANEHFGTTSKQGWKTDRGRTYITYGQPNEIERHPFEIDYYSYEVWYYYSLNLTLVFVDQIGDGDYRLKETK
ncbi:GWxTD domain-containing protein [bacterium]|nr:GWxTD domain-containing protein [bacterium]